MPDQFAYDVFLSHNSQDKPRVRRLAERLKAEGLRVWFDEWVIQPGDIIALKVDDGLEQSRVLLLCISPGALASGWVALERSTATHRDPANADRRFIPILLGDCDLPDTLRLYKYVDFRVESERALAEVLTACDSKSKSNRGIASNQSEDASVPTTRNSWVEFERKCSGHKDAVNSLSISGDGLWLASGSNDGSIRLWDTKTFSCYKVLEGREYVSECVSVKATEVNSVSFMGRGQRLASCGGDGLIRIWEIPSGEEIKHLRGDLMETWFVVGLRDGLSFLADTSPEMLSHWDYHWGMRNRSISAQPNKAFCAAVDQNEEIIICGHGNGSITIWTLSSFTWLGTFAGHSDLVYSVQIAADASFAVSGSKDCTVKLWDMKTRLCLATFEGHTDDVVAIAISPDSQFVVSAGWFR